MSAEVNLEAAYAPSEDVVAREIEGELIIVPLVAGIGDMEDELYTLNATGKAIWARLDGKGKLRDVVAQLSQEYEAPVEEIEKDLIDLLRELVRRKIVVEVLQD